MESAKIIATKPFSLEELQERIGRPSTQTIYRRLHKWQEELGQTGRPNARSLIVDYAIQNTWKQLLEMLEKEEKQLHHNPIDLLKVFIGQVVHFFHENRALATILTRGTPSWALRSPRSFTSYQRALWGQLRTITHRAQEEGFLTKTIDPDLLLRLIHGALHEALYGLTLRGVMNEHYEPQDVIDAIAALLNRLRDDTPSVVEHLDQKSLKIRPLRIGRGVPVPTTDMGIGVH